MPEATPGIVLVHGAWHGSWCWQFLANALRAQGRTVHLLDLPSVVSDTPVGLSEDAAALTALINQIGAPVMVCGHSYGGMVMSAADFSRANVRQLVYLSAYMAQAGECVDASLRAAGERRPGYWIRTLPDGRTRVDGARAAALFYQDCSDDTAQRAIAQLRPQWGQVLTEHCATPAWEHYPSTYVLCSEDRVLAPEIQREVYAPRADHVLTLATGHSPFLSQPLQLMQMLVSVTQ